MIRKDYLIENTHADHEAPGQANEQMKKEIMSILDIAFADGAIVELKILEGVDLANGGKRFSKLRLDIISNTDFDRYETT